MADEENKQQPTPGKGKDMRQKNAREARLKKSLRANLQRRKTKMRAIKATDTKSDQD